MVVFFVQLHFTTRVRYGFLSVQLNYTIRHKIIYHALKYLLMQIAYYLLSYSYNGIAIKGQQ